VERDETFIDPQVPHWLKLAMMYKYSNWVDVQHYCLATGKWREADAITPRLKLYESERRDLRILYWREPGPQGKAGVVDLLNEALAKGRDKRGEREVGSGQRTVPFLRHPDPKSRSTKVSGEIGYRMATDWVLFE
jgi:hypothetical protein